MGLLDMGSFIKIIALYIEHYKVVINFIAYNHQPNKQSIFYEQFKFGNC